MSGIRPLNTTSIYAVAEDSSSQNLTNKVMAYSLLKNGTIEIRYDDVADVMYDITSRTSPFFSKYAVDALLKSGKLQLVYNSELRLTTAIPFFKTTINGKPKMIINLTNFSNMRKDGSIVIASNTLYALLLSAAFALDIDSKIYSFMRETYAMYARMFTSVVANLTHMDNVKKEKIQYLAANFYFYQVYAPDRAFTNPMKGKMRHNSNDSITMVDNMMPMWGDYSSYESLQIFIESLVKVFPEMKKLTFHNFIDRWTLSYGSSSLFACEYIPYFFYMIISAACLSQTLNINKIQIEADKGLTEVYKRIEQSVNTMI